jgi:hypothetical protein
MFDNTWHKLLSTGNKGASHTIPQTTQLCKYGGTSIKLFTVFMPVGDEEIKLYALQNCILSYNESEQTCGTYSLTIRVPSERKCY